MLKFSLKKILKVKVLTIIFFLWLVYISIDYSVEPSYVIQPNDLPKAVEAAEEVLELTQEEDEFNENLTDRAFLIGLVILILPPLYYFWPPR